MKSWLKRIGIQFGVTFISLALLVGLGGPILNLIPIASVQKSVYTIGLQGVAYAVTPDYQVDGVADDVQVQTALNALPVTGGRLVLFAGNYVFAATVSRAINNITFEGDGKGTYIAYNGATAVISAGAQTGWVFKDFRTDAGWVTVSSAGDTRFLGALWKGTELVSNVLASGTTMPSSPIVGQQFYQDTTGRDVIYTYNGTSWLPTQSFGTLTYYVDTASGTDDLNHGTGTTTNAFRTVNYAYNAIPRAKDSVATVYVSGTVNEHLEWQAGEGNVIFIGATSANYSGTATGGFSGNSTAAPYVTGAFVAGTYENKLLKFTSGTNSGEIRVVGQNTAARLYLVGDPLAGNPLNNDTYQILNLTPFTGWLRLWGTGSNSRSSVPPNAPGASVIFQYFAFSGAGDGSRLLYVNSAAAEVDYCTFTNTGASVATVQAEVGAWLGIYYSDIYHTAASYGAYSQFRAQIDALWSRFAGNGVGAGLIGSDMALATAQGCEFTDWANGIWATVGGGVSIMGATFNSQSHGNNAGAYADRHGYIFINGEVTYGKLLDGTTADVNTVADQATEAASFSYITS